MDNSSNGTIIHIHVPISRVRRSSIPLPQYATEGSSGMDLYADLDEHVTILPGEVATIPTGIRISLPRGFEAQVRPRSGLALEHRITVLNTPGTIDSDYRGEIHVILINFGHLPFVVHSGDRIAQLVIAPVAHVEWTETEALDITDRGEGGFGHTGIRRRQTF